MSQWHGGKGSKPRKVDKGKFSENWDKIFRKEKDVGLGFNDGFPPPNGFWEHYCEVEKDKMGVEKGFPCNWCGKMEEDLELDNDA